MSALDDLIQRVIAREGGVADVGDGKGITRWGQTPDWLTQFGLPVPQNAVDAAANYVKWIDLIVLHPLVDAGDDLADILLDIAVMSSGPKAVKALQSALNVSVDGALGPQTLLALSTANRKQLARDVIAWDMIYQGSLVTLDPTRAKWAKGWAERMAGHVVRLS